ncbi:MAG: hypothetical protein ACRCUT_00365 [Spirochaetota bacterium]
MKKSFAMIVMCAFAVSAFTGCGLKQFEKIIRPTMNVNDAVAEKEELDRADNPAKKYVITNDLGKKLIEVTGAVVKDIIPSTDIDYDFCVIAQVVHEKGTIDFYIYSKDNKTIAKLEKGKTKIWSLGDFRRFFSLLDDSFIKIDMADADITILK